MNLTIKIKDKDFTMENIKLDSRQSEIDHCLKACVNLYGFVTPRQFLKVFNKYYSPKLLKKELMDNADILEGFSGRYYTIYENAILNARVSEKKINDIIYMQKDKAYDMPTEAELDSFAKTGYYQQNEATEKLFTMLTKDLKVNILTANGFISKLVWFTVTDESMQKRMNLINEFGIGIKNMHQRSALSGLLMQLDSTVKKWANCGYSPVEMRNSQE